MYAGDVECVAVFENLKGDQNSALVDVRTTREWANIGVPDLSGINKEAIFVEWQKFPTMEVNAEFAERVNEELQKQGVSLSDPVYFLCRSGVRSQAAAIALTQRGYTKAFNIIGGFEGAPDNNGERGKVSGWIFDDLPQKGRETKE